LGKPVGVALTILGKKNRQPESQGPLVNAALQLGGKLVINKEITK